MRLRSGLDLDARESESEIRSQLSGASDTRTDMEEHNFTDFSSNRAEIGSPRRSSGSPLESVTSPHQSPNGDSRPASLPSTQYGEYQTTSYRAIAPATYPHATYSTPSSSSYHTPYSESSIQTSYPTTTSAQQYTNTTLPESSHHSYLQPYTTSSQESINSSSPYPNPPPPAVPTPPPPPHHCYPSPFYTSQYTTEPQPQPTQTHPAPLNPQQTYNQPHPHPLTTTLPQLSQPDPWSPLARNPPPESRKRRASETGVGLGIGVRNQDWGYKDKMREELDSLEAELRASGEGSVGVGEEGRKKRRKGRGDPCERGNAKGGGRRWSNDEGEDGDGDERE